MIEQVNSDEYQKAFGQTYISVELVEHAIEMEKEQIIYSYSEAWHDGQDVIINQIKHVDLGGDKAGEQYYNETYKPNKP